VDEGKALDVVYLDFHKAFDSVSHSILLQELHPMAWRGTLLGTEPENGGGWSYTQLANGH